MHPLNYTLFMIKGLQTFKYYLFHIYLFPVLAHMNMASSLTATNAVLWTTYQQCSIHRALRQSTREI